MSAINTPAQGFAPTDDQLNFEISPAWDTIRAELDDLQQSLCCPDDFIVGMLGAIAASFRAAEVQP